MSLKSIFTGSDLALPDYFHKISPPQPNCLNWASLCSVYPHSVPGTQCLLFTLRRSFPHCQSWPRVLAWCPGPAVLAGPVRDQPATAGPKREGEEHLQHSCLQWGYDNGPKLWKIALLANILMVPVKCMCQIHNFPQFKTATWFNLKGSF